MKLPQRLVVKFGTQNLFNGLCSLSSDVFCDYAKQIHELMGLGTEVIIVSSGAIQAGREIATRNGIAEGRLHKKELAALGTAELMHLWKEAFNKIPGGRPVAQILVTYANWESDKERGSIQSSILSFVACGVIPVINENDVVSQREIQSMEKGISENDRLARMIALLIKADAVLFLTDVNGIFTGSPKQGSSVLRYAEVKAGATAKELGISAETSDSNGGMIAKIKEASQCFIEGGMRVAIAGNQENVICRFVAGEPIGTLVGDETRLE
ncbi:MAG: hypothetical protein WC619_04835 [Patescibacteria group bacterium]